MLDRLVLFVETRIDVRLHTNPERPMSQWEWGVASLSSVAREANQNRRPLLVFAGRTAESIGLNCFRWNGTQWSEVVLILPLFYDEDQIFTSRRPGDNGVRIATTGGQLRPTCCSRNDTPTHNSNSRSRHSLIVRKVATNISLIFLVTAVVAWCNLPRTLANNMVTCAEAFSIMYYSVCYNG